MDIDFDFLVQLLKSQNFRCFYSGVPLHFPCLGSCEPLYRMSLERIDPRPDYIKGNVCLIGAGFQSVDYTRTRKVPVQGSSGWSKSKVDFVVRLLGQQREMTHAGSC
jgi:hypothetical protein